MTDEVQTPPDAEDTSIAAPEEDTRPVVDYEQRYNSLRPDYDRKSQRLAELEAEREQWLQAQQEPDEEEFEDFEFADEALRREFNELKAQLQTEREERETLQKQAEESNFIDSELEAIEKETEDELSEAESNWIGNYALANRGEDGKPDVRLAYKTYLDLLEGRKSKWISTKKAPRPGAGAAAKEKINLDTPDARSRYMAERLSELDA